MLKFFYIAIKFSAKEAVSCASSEHTSRTGHLPSDSTAMRDLLRIVSCPCESLMVKRRRGMEPVNAETSGVAAAPLEPSQMLQQPQILRSSALLVLLKKAACTSGYAFPVCSSWNVGRFTVKLRMKRQYVLGEMHAWRIILDCQLR